MPISEFIRKDSSSSNIVQPIQKNEEPPQESTSIAPKTSLLNSTGNVKRVSRNNLPNFSFTGNLHEISSSSGLEGSNNNVQLKREGINISDEEIENYLAQNWEKVLQALKQQNRIRMMAALQSPKFSKHDVIAVVANSAIEQEILTQKMTLQDMAFDLLKVNVNIVPVVSKTDIHVARPVSDPQRLEEMLKNYSSVKYLCKELKLRF